MRVLHEATSDHPLCGFMFQRVCHASCLTTDKWVDIFYAQAMVDLMDSFQNSNKFGFVCITFSNAKIHST